MFDYKKAAELVRVENFVGDSWRGVICKTFDRLLRNPERFLRDTISIAEMEELSSILFRYCLAYGGAKQDELMYILDECIAYEKANFARQEFARLGGVIATDGNFPFEWYELDEVG